MVVDAGVDNERAVDGEVPVVLPEVVEDILVDVLGYFPPVLPEDVAGDPHRWPG